MGLAWQGLLGGGIWSCKIHGAPHGARGTPLAHAPPKPLASTCAGAVAPGPPGPSRICTFSSSVSPPNHNYLAGCSACQQGACHGNGPSAAHALDVSTTTPLVLITLVQIALLGYDTLYAKIGFSVAQVAMEFITICNKVFHLVGTKGCIFIRGEFCYLDHELRVCDFGTTSMVFR